MTNKKDAKTTGLAIPAHMQEAVEAQNSTTSMYWSCAELKVYNPPISGKDDSPESNGKIFIWKPSEKIEYWTEIEWTILYNTKSWCWWIPNEFWGKDVYWTDEVWMWDKAIKLKGMKQLSEEPKDREEVVFGAWSIDNLYKLIQDQDGPFFRKMAESMDGEKYPVSWLDKVNMLYIKTEWGETFRLNPKSSFWKYNNIKPWTIEQMKIDATNAYNAWVAKSVKSVDLSHCKFKAKVKQIEVMSKTFNVLDWQFDWFVQDNLLKDVEAVKWLVKDNNATNFEGVTKVLPASAAALTLEAPKLDPIDWIDVEAVAPGISKKDQDEMEAAFN